MYNIENIVFCCFLESTLPHSYYNTIHGASPDKRICMLNFASI